ncbi:MAG TPA: TraB/GumN family protein [Puia sp.]|nr:TraB/GumN family protein [Puia sp.]
MKKILSAFSCLLLTSLVFPQAALQKSANTLLWEVTGKDLQKPTYIFGTMHILCSDDATLSSGLKGAIKKCDEVYFEIDLSDMMGMINSMKFMNMNDNKKLSDLLSAEDYAKVKKYFEKHPSMLPFSMLEKFKPMFISSLMEEEDLPCKSTNGMEMVIMKEAHKNNKKINGLETAEFQASLFDSIPYKDQAQDIIKYIDSSEEYKKMTDTLAQAYKDQDLNKIELLTAQESSGTSAFMDLLLYKRNRNWAKKLQLLMPQKSLLIAVGAGHLPGEEGILNLLRKLGYTVSPITTIGEEL